MSTENEINWSVAEKFSYAYVDEKYAKIGVIANGSATLVDPLAWSYAETHSYVKVDPSEIGISVPSGVTELYAKVLYVPGGVGTGSTENGTTSEKDPIFKSVSGSFATKTYVDEHISGFVTSAYIDDKLEELVLSNNLSDFNNNVGFITSAYVNDQVNDLDETVQTTLNENYYTKEDVNNLIQQVKNEFSEQLIKVVASVGGTTSLSDRTLTSVNDNLIMNERTIQNTINEAINYGERL